MNELAEHLVERYEVTVEGLVALDRDVYRVDGPGWVARWLPAGSDDAAAATADLLRRLEPTRFPAERLAHPEPVSVCRGRPLLVTEFVDGKPAPGTPRVFAVFGGLLGALHERPGNGLPPGGAWHHLVAQGTPREEITAAISLLSGADGDPAARHTLLEDLRGLDDCSDLPHAIVHPDFVPMNAILRPGRGMVIIDWAGSGRGPRLWSLGFVLWTAGVRDLAVVEPLIGRYRERVQLTAAERNRLPDVIRARPLTIDCWSVAHGRLDAAVAVQRLDRHQELAKQIADRAHRAFDQ